jgi:hypothetical protein
MAGANGNHVAVRRADAFLQLLLECADIAAHAEPAVLILAKY